MAGGIFVPQIREVLLMIIVNFDKNELCKKAYGLWQYDYGQVLRIQGLNLPTAAEIHFALQETGGEAVTRIGITKDGVTDVTIPDSLLEADGASQDYQIYVFIYLATPDSGETTRRITLGVKSRPRPDAFNTPGEGELFEEAIQAVNDAAKRAEDAGKEATAAAEEARESASLAGKHLEDTKALAEQVEINADAVAQGKEEAARLLAQTQEAASNAALSAGVAKQSETAAREAQTAAETAEDAARQYAEETEADRQEVTESKQSVTQMQSDVANMQADVQADKEAVEQTVSEFGTAAQNALTAIGQAQNTAVSAVTEEGQKQATAVQETGTQAVSEVDAAKTAAVEAVASEGDKQVGRVKEAAAEIAADREQIQKNKTDIAALTDKTNTLAPGIVLGAKGGAIAVHNASEQPFVGLNVYGKSTQVKTTGAQLLDAKKLEIGGLSGNTGIPVETDSRLRIAEIEIKPKETYSISGYAPTYVLQNSHVFNVDGERLSSFLSGSPTPDGAARVSLCFKKSDDSKMTETDIQYLAKQLMLNVGGESLPWEPYTGGKPSPSPEYPQEITSAGDNGTLEVKIADSGEKSQRLIIQMPNGLAGIPVTSGGNYTDEVGQQWVCDEIDLTRGVSIQRIEKHIFGNNDSFVIDTALDEKLNRFSWREYQSKAKKETPIMCDIFKFSGFSELKQENSMYGAKNFSRCFIYVDKNISEEKFKALINGKKSFYVLETPIITPLTSEEIAAYKSLHTYSGTTVVANDSGVGMSLTYTVDTKKYVDKKIAAISAAMIGG